MTNEINRGAEAQNDPRTHEDEAIPAASEDRVLEETVRLAREGRKELESDPKEQKPRPQ
jgi:hypothetical protein